MLALRVKLRQEKALNKIKQQQQAKKKDQQTTVTSKTTTRSASAPKRTITRTNKPANTSTTSNNILQQPTSSTPLAMQIQQQVQQVEQVHADAILAAQFQAEQLPSSMVHSSDLACLMTPRTFDDFQMAFAISLSLVEQDAELLSSPANVQQIPQQQPAVRPIRPRATSSNQQQHNFNLLPSNTMNHDTEDMSYESLIQLEDVKVGLAMHLRKHIPLVSSCQQKNEYVE